MTTFTHTAPQARDFSAATRRALLKARIRIVGATAAPAFEGDAYNTGTAYMLDIDGKGCLRTFREVLKLAGA